MLYETWISIGHKLYKIQNSSINNAIREESNANNNQETESEYQVTPTTIPNFDVTTSATI